MVRGRAAVRKDIDPTIQDMPETQTRTAGESGGRLAEEAQSAAIRALWTLAREMD